MSKLCISLRIQAVLMLAGLMPGLDAPRAGAATTTVAQAAGVFEVVLSWQAPQSSADPVTGYNVYQEPASGSSYTKLTSSPTTSLGYTDTTVVTNQAYSYYVTSVDAEGNESGPSNIYSVTIPATFTASPTGKTAPQLLLAMK